MTHLFTFKKSNNFFSFGNS